MVANLCLTECMTTKECSPAKHHYDECVERVTGKIENDGKSDEDCVEECRNPSPSNNTEIHTDNSAFVVVFHLIHCASACAAPKLWRELK